ncbi:MAG: excinuclease ABC subunit UvrC [Longimicrobiaceae bacterium]
MVSTPDLASKLRHLPARPGVYLFKDAAGRYLYVGKAKSLRPRVRSYFNSNDGAGIRTRELVRRVADVDTIVVGSEAEALLLENNLIKEYRPRFNVNLRDDKTYPYIKVTVQEPFPRVFVTRRLQRDGARYFGPYTDVRRMRRTLELVKKLFTVRSCRFRLPDDAPDRPCLDYHIGKCQAPCVELQSETDYREMIDEVVDVLLGRTRRAAERLRRRMGVAAEGMNFEAAATLRDALARLEELESKQRMFDLEGMDRDALAIARDGAEGCGVVLRIREGKLLGREVQFLAHLDRVEEDEALAAFATRYYAVRSAEHADDLPAEIFFPCDFADRPALEALLRERAGRALRTRVPQRGEKTLLIELAERNARHLLEERKLLEHASRSRAPDALYELQEQLGLEAVPRRIVGFDISHTQGSETVGAGVVFTAGEPDKAGYRRFRVRGEWGNDDFRSMHEVVTRYFARLVEEGADLPGLVLIDGGKGQLGAALRALAELGLDEQRAIGLAKREEEVFLAASGASLRLPRRSAALRLLQRVRDESHRFAVGYNRNLRTKRTVSSVLAEIPGIGPARQKRLLEHFGSLHGVADASPEEIARLPGFGDALARSVVSAVAAESRTEAGV